MLFNIFSGTVIRMNTDGTDVRVMIRGLSLPRGLATICLPTNESKTTIEPGMVSSATTTLGDTNPVFNQSDVAIVTGMLNITDFIFYTYDLFHQRPPPWLIQTMFSINRMLTLSQVCFIQRISSF